MKNYTLVFSTVISEHREKVFDFFSQAKNLEKLSPPHLKFTILTPTPIIMKTGTLIDYRLQIYKLPVRWQTEIRIWEPPRRFVDTQLKGPYKKWIHEHRFDEFNGETEMHDRIDYQLYGGILSSIINTIFIKRDIKKVFRFREEKLNEIFG